MSISGALVTQGFAERQGRAFTENTRAEQYQPFFGPKSPEFCKLSRAIPNNCAEIKNECQPTSKSTNFDAGHFRICIQIPDSPELAELGKLVGA
jgi:hypothetical protein